MAVTLLSGLFIRVLDYWNPYEQDDIPEDQRFNAKESLWYSFGAVSQGGSAFAAIMYPIRIFSVFYWFFALVICACYTGNLASFLTESYQLVPNMRLVELSERNSKGEYRYNWGTLMGSYSEDFIHGISRERADAVVLSSRMKYTRGYEEGVRLAKESQNYAFIGNNLLLDYYAGKQ